MPRTRAIERTVKLTISLDEGLYAKLALHLWSEVEGRVPVGAWKAFFEARMREFFERLERKEEK